MTESRPDSINVTLAEAVVDVLARETDTFFGLPGGYLSPFQHAAHLAGVRIVIARNETSGAFMAAGHAIGSGQLGVFFAVPGGVSHTASALAAAGTDRVPFFLLAGQIPSSHFGRNGHQETTGHGRSHDQITLLRTVTRSAHRVGNAIAAPRIVRSAVTVARGERQPVAVEVPADLWSSNVDHVPRGPVGEQMSSAVIDAGGIEELATRIRKAERATFVFGGGSRWMGLSEPLRQLVEASGAAFCVVGDAKGIIAEDHPLCLGVLGMYGHDSCLDALRLSDLVIAIGVRMSWANTVNWQPDIFPNLVQIEPDHVELTQEYPLLQAIVGDMPATVGRLSQLMADKPLPARRSATADLVASLRKSHDVYPSKGGDSSSTPDMLMAMRRVLPRDALIVADTGLTAQYLKKHFPVYAAEGFYTLYGLASMGHSAPLAIGVGFAKPHSTVVNVIGDGGFLMFPGCLSVQKEHSVPVLHVVINNGGFKQIGDRVETLCGNRGGCDFGPVDVAAVARGMGLAAATATTPGELQGAVRELLEAGTGGVIDVRVAGDNFWEVTPPAVRDLTVSLYRGLPDRWRIPRGSDSASD